MVKPEVLQLDITGRNSRSIAAGYGRKGYLGNVDSTGFFVCLGKNSHCVCNGRPQQYLNRSFPPVSGPCDLLPSLRALMFVGCILRNLAVNQVRVPNPAFGRPRTL
jgi:hypothetical protein